MTNRLKNPKLIIPALVVIAALAWLAFGYFAVQTLFVDDKVNESAPTFASQTTTTNTSAPTTVTASTVDPATTPATTPPTPQVVAEATGEFVSVDHDTSGTATVLGDGSGVRFLRFENFETSNGPDLNVYLVNRDAGGVSDFVDLGDLKGNIGDQNYEIPIGTDLALYDTVVIWCVRFSSPFGEATLILA